MSGSTVPFFRKKNEKSRVSQMSPRSSPVGRLAPRLAVQGRPHARRRGRLGKPRPGVLAPTAGEEGPAKLLGEAAAVPAPCPGRARREGPRSPVGETVSGEQDAGWGGQSGLLFHDRLRRTLAFCCHACAGSPRTTMSLTSNGSPGEPGEAPRGRGKSTWGSGSGRTRSSCLWGPGRLWGPWCQKDGGG